MEHIYKVGDRVIYEARDFGNAELNGAVGTIIKIDNTGCPYTVCFDKVYGFSVWDERVHKKYRDRLWWCKEENLSLAGDEKIESETETMEFFEWTDEKIARLKELIRAGRSTTEMCAVFGIDAKCLANKVYALRKQDPTLPGGYKKGKKNPQQAPELGELEQQMSEVITELKTENDNLRGEIKALTDKIAELEAANTEFAQRNTKLGQRVFELESELKDTAEAYQKTEAAWDAERRDMRATEIECAGYLKLIAKLADRAIA